MSHPPGDSESRLRLVSMKVCTRTYGKHISEVEYGNPSQRFAWYCAGKHEDDREPEYAERLNKGFKTIGEEHHEKSTPECKYHACESWDHWDF